MMHIILKIIRVRVAEESKGQDSMLEVERPKEILEFRTRKSHA